VTSDLISSPWQLGLAAFVIGLSGAMSPGPYLTVTIARTLREGRLAAMLMLVGHALLEAVLLIGFAFGLASVLKLPKVAIVMSVVGGIVLLWMGGSLLWGAWRGTVVADLQAAENPSRLGPVAHGAIVSLSNPYWTLWWATIGITLAIKGLEFGPVGVFAFFVGHEVADIAWYTIVIFAVSAGRHLLSDRIYRGVMAVLACFLLYLGATFVLGAL
jgi:threonine/homoserine/homoserine lactone efflux protein